MIKWLNDKYSCQHDTPVSNQECSSQGLTITSYAMISRHVGSLVDKDSPTSELFCILTRLIKRMV